MAALSTQKNVLKLKSGLEKIINEAKKSLRISRRHSYLVMPITVTTPFSVNANGLRIKHGAEY